ncbi:MAG: tRNA pseudouridine(38-40) synthase TruA [Nitrospirae bacterium]|nr:tRNA pseudouridine(38-40) synthase TruA [Nitrospirota bacterium]
MQQGIYFALPRNIHDIIRWVKLRRIKIILQYDGTDYSGWQVQKEAITIQQILESAVYSVTGEHERVTGAARTDAGVHAFAQVAAFKTRSNLEPQVLFRALNANLPHDIRVIRAEECPEDFHPRYSARDKTYSYLITHPVDYSVFLRPYSWQIYYQLNCGLMREAAECLIGKHDFACFRASGCSSKSPVRTISTISISESPSVDFMNFTFNVPLIKISIRADAFLRHMVRNIVGTLVEIGRDRHPAAYMKEVLALRNRSFAGPTAPAHGLFLEEINY